jgi:hypothetical protein
MKTWCLIPTVGGSSWAAGHETPKPLLLVDWRGTAQHMISHVLDTVPENVRCVVGLPVLWDTPRTWCLKIFGEMRGSAETVQAMLNIMDTCLDRETIPDDARVLCLDCDALLATRDISRVLAEIDRGADAAVAVARVRKVKDVAATMSFARVANESDWTWELDRDIDVAGRVVDLVEKVAISRWGCVSARAFRSAALLRGALEALAPHETGLTDALAHLVESGGDVRAVAVKKWVDWGTPEALEASGARIVERAE